LFTQNNILFSWDEKKIYVWPTLFRLKTKATIPEPQNFIDITFIENGPIVVESTEDEQTITNIRFYILLKKNMYVYIHNITQSLL